MNNVRTVLQVNSKDKGGGAETLAWNLFEAYRKRGLNSWLAVGSKFSKDLNVKEISNAPYITNPWSKTILSLSETLSPLRQYGMPGTRLTQKYLRYLAKPSIWQQQKQGWEDFDYPGTWHLLSQFPSFPDVIHCHNLHPSYFDLNALTHLSRIRPVILHLHDAWLLSGHCSHSRDCKRWKTGCGSCPYLQTYPAILKDNTAANWQRKQAIYAKSRLYITTVSQWLMDKVDQSILSTNYQNRPVQKRVIHNSIDLSIFKTGSQKEARSRLKLPKNAKIVLLSAHNAFKDYPTMEAALSKLTTNGQPLLFICLGRTDTQKKLGAGQIIYPGWVKSPAIMAQYYQAADVYIHAAHEEAFGIAIGEAGASGTAIVATDIGGIAEQMVNGQTGFLVPPRAPKAMAVAVQKLLDDKELCQQIGRTAANYVEKHFSKEQHVDKFLLWYNEIIADWHQKNGTDK